MGENPRLKTPVFLGMMAVLLLAFAVYIQRRDFDDVIAVGIVGGIGTVLFGASVVSGINWVIYEWWHRDIERRRAQAVTPMLELVQAVSRLNSDQIGLVGLQNYRAIMEMVGTDSGPVYMLRTFFGPIPADFVHTTLLKSTPLGLPSIRQYADGTPEREWARWFAHWCVEEAKIAVPAEGPYAARWLERGGRNKAANMLGLQLYNSNFEAEEE